MSEQKKKEARSRREQAQEGKNPPASDLYGSIEGKDPETGVEQPTEEAVEQSREWINENQR